MVMRLLDLFSGIGGFSYAAEKLVGGYETVAFCEQEEFCQQVLRKHWQDIPIFDDVRTIDANRLGRIDIVTGGFPCQPVSQAGLQKATEDDRWLWDEMLRIIKDCKPKWVIGENVVGLVNINEGILFEQVQTDLEKEGYSVQSVVIPACAKNAPHIRNRVWIIGHYRGDEFLANPKCNQCRDEIRRKSEQEEGIQIELWETDSSTRKPSRASDIRKTSDEYVTYSDNNGHKKGCVETRNETSSRQNTQSKWRANTENIKRQSNDGLDSGEPRVNEDLSRSSDRGTTISSDTTGVCKLFENTDNDQGISIKNKYQENNDRALVSQRSKGVQLSEHRGLEQDKTITENNQIRSRDDNNSNERMDNKKSNVSNTKCNTERTTYRSNQRRNIRGWEDKNISEWNEMGSNIGNDSCIDGETENVSEFEQQRKKTTTIKRRMGYMDDGLSEALSGHFSEEPKDIPRVAQNQKDRTKKLKALGNSIVPQVAAEILYAIKVAEDES